MGGLSSSALAVPAEKLSRAHELPSLGGGIGDRHFDQASDLEYDVANARIWGGIHFHLAVEVGTIAAKTADHVLAHEFKKSN